MFNTKDDYCKCLGDILNPLKKYYSNGKASAKCGVAGFNYSTEAALLESYARPLWGLAPLWSSNEDIDGFSDIYLQGIINGTDPNHSEYWGSIGDCDQKIVEAAPIGLALAIAPEKIWDPLTENQKKNLHTWLWQVNEVENVESNWQFFTVLVNLGFKRVGAKYSQQIIDKSVAAYHSYYLSNGWYADGFSTQRDYYISFAIHFYSLIYAKLAEEFDPENSRIFKERATLFAKDFIYWFDEDGSALAFGRSLTYRFAQCAFWSACVFADVRPFPMGVMKGIISRNMEFWMKQPIFDNDGILSIGYGYPNLCMAESYNAYGSPYWALKSFLILALDKDHEFYKTNILPLPNLDSLRIMPEARMVIQRVNGGVYAITAGQWATWRPAHTPEKYSKFVYSSRYAFSTPRSYFYLEYAGADNMLVFVKDNMCFVRKNCDSYEILSDGTVFSKWSPFPNVYVESCITPTPNGHIRHHIIQADSDWTVYDCSVSVKDDGDTGTIESNIGNNIIVNTVNTNLLFPKAKMSAIQYDISAGRTEITSTVIYPNTH